MVSNAQRAFWASLGLGAYLKPRGSSGSLETDVQDLINDLVHLLRIEMNMTADEFRTLADTAITHAEIERREDS